MANPKQAIADLLLLITGGGVAAFVLLGIFFVDCGPGGGTDSTSLDAPDLVSSDCSDPSSLKGIPDDVLCSLGSWRRNGAGEEFEGGFTWWGDLPRTADLHSLVMMRVGAAAATTTGTVEGEESIQNGVYRFKTKNTSKGSYSRPDANIHILSLAPCQGMPKNMVRVAACVIPRGESI